MGLTLVSFVEGEGEAGGEGVGGGEGGGRGGEGRRGKGRGESERGVRHERENVGL